ncbi:MAG: glutathione S-transferase family protein [Planctomycetes bacterium]|nr:glutathione S-transferase family protein [Planctomycetota bacterium]
MTPSLDVHGFETSNNIKVRVALGFKGLTYTFHSIDPVDRSGIQRISGQNLTPVLVHGDRVVFDSAAILRYLESTFPDTPRLFGSTRDEQWAIEDLEALARYDLARPMLEVVHRRVSGGVVDPGMQVRCNGRFVAALGTLIEHLGTRTFLVGDALTAADITAAAVVHRVRTGGLFELPAAAAALDPWVARVLAFDGRGRTG